MSNTINRYRELDRTLTIEVASHITTFKTRGTAFRQKQSVKIGSGESLTTRDIGISESEGFDLPMNGITKVLMVTSPHRFKIMYRPDEASEFVLLAVCEGLYTNTGIIMGQIRLVGDYTDPVRCTVVYA